MTRWAMVADLRRCVGCQTCTASCKHANATPPGVQWRRVLDMEVGEYPDVQRAFVPVGCQHCDEPPCMDVCPTTATKKRADGIVTIDYDLCIGCAYCAVACPYQARYKTDARRLRLRRQADEQRERSATTTRSAAVATKCTFCVDRIDAGLAKGLTPGVDPEATPACVNACIAEALTFGDLDDPQSNVSQLLARNAAFPHARGAGHRPGLLLPVGSGRQHELRTQPLAAAALGLARRRQLHVRRRRRGPDRVHARSPARAASRGTLLVLAGLGAGRPRPALRVARDRPAAARDQRDVQRAHLVDVARGASSRCCCSRWAWAGSPAWRPGPFRSRWRRAGLRLLPGAHPAGRQGHPAWREPLTVPLLVATGLAEGAGLFWLVGAWLGPGVAAARHAVRACWWPRAGWPGARGATPRRHASPRALAAHRPRRAARCNGWAASLPLVLAALAIAACCRSPGAACCSPIAGLLRRRGRRRIQVHARHARRVQPGLRAGAPAGARRAALT